MIMAVVSNIFEIYNIQSPSFLYCNQISSFHFLFNFLTKLKFSFPFNNCSLDVTGRCRWSSNPDEPLLYVKYDLSQLNILDVEKGTLILKSPVEIDSKGKASRCLILIFLLLFPIGERELTL